jgi:hypothetical protein
MMKGMGKGLPADQREQGVDEQRDELVDQVAELGADDDRDGELHQVPAHDEVLETAHADRLPARRKIFLRSHRQQDPEPPGHDNYAESALAGSAARRLLPLGRD